MKNTYKHINKYVCMYFMYIFPHLISFVTSNLYFLYLLIVSVSIVFNNLLIDFFKWNFAYTSLEKLISKNKSSVNLLDMKRRKKVCDLMYISEAYLVKINSSRLTKRFFRILRFLTVENYYVRRKNPLMTNTTNLGRLVQFSRTFYQL